MKKLKRLLGDKTGTAYIDTLIMVLVAAIMLSLLISIISVGIDYTKVVCYTNALVDNAKVCGEIDSDPTTYSDLAANTGLDKSRITYTWNAQYFDESTGKLAFEQPFSLTVTYACTLPLLNSSTTLTLPVVCLGKGVSEVFWK